MKADPMTLLFRAQSLATVLSAYADAGDIGSASGILHVQNVADTVADLVDKAIVLLGRQSDAAGGAK